MPVGGTQRKAFAGSKLAVSQGIDVDETPPIKGDAQRLERVKGIEPSS
jgi:hypothetical protein